MTPTDPAAPADAPVPQRPAPEPLMTNDRLTVAIGSGIWALLLVVALLRRDDLEATGRGWWVWACVCGLVLGLVGLSWLRVRAARQGRHPA